jgi:hypothetical protein
MSISYLKIYFRPILTNYKFILNFQKNLPTSPAQIKALGHYGPKGAKKQVELDHI